MDRRSLLIGCIVGLIIGAGLPLLYAGQSSDKQVTGLPPYYFAEGIPGFAGANGTWVVKGEKLVNQYNSAEINCFNNYGEVSLDKIRAAGLNDEMYCYIAQADLFRGLLASSLMLYQVTEWSPEKIVSEAKGSCRTVTMTIDRRSKTITQEGVLVNSTNELCKGLSPEPVQSYLADGLKIITGEIK